MRRIVSIFATKRSDKSDASSSPGDSKPAPMRTHTLPRQKKASRLFGTAPRITIAAENPTPALDQGHSSSSSSSISGSLRTPDDDRASPMAPPIIQTASHRSWVPFRPVKKSQPTPSLVATFGITTPSPVALPTRMLNADTESDYMSESLSSESDAHPPSTAVVNRLSAVEFVTTLTSNNLGPSFSPPPLLHLPNAPVFPRSSNPSRSLASQDSLESTMHKKRLLRRLQRRHELLPSEQRSLAAFGSRPATAAIRRALPQPDEGARIDLKYVEANSLGLRRWVNRPYFEERTTMWVPDEQTGTITAVPVKGSGFGVWALEISEAVEILAGVTSDEVQNPHIGMWDPPSSASSSSSLLSAPPAVTSKQPAFKALPSPLRNSGVSFDEHLPTAESSRTIRPASIPDLVAPVPAPKRGVRFAETNKPDQVPQDYIARVRKQRQEKAKFLQEERERRLHEEERMKHEAERRQWEMEKEIWEREKRALEEERRKKAYAEEVAAARARREGSYHSLSASIAERRGRETRESYSRPAYDPRKQPESPAPRPRNDSPSSSRAYSPSRSSVNGSPLFVPRPTSTYSVTPVSSAEASATATREPATVGEGPWSPIPPIGYLHTRMAGSQFRSPCPPFRPFLCSPRCK
ncbi:hypothetical protein EWM64_g4954 [Hericium alpestre]|uniref:Uncharacterized protein n=1 Tax=Hericium alpestre TaxID=135208 RepID=A0A4Y9ZVZ5_9AGAM|nr:hypothetical protein EWM64_g4954 [Hericium alpestre]